MRSLVVFLFVAALTGSAAHAQNETEVLFGARCARCHGRDGAGRTTAAQKMHIPDLRSSKVQKLTDDEMFATIAEGRDHHNYPHVFRSLGLSDAQVRQLVKYIRELAKHPGATKHNAHARHRASDTN